MATVDLRQKTQRHYHEQKPFWITSGDIKPEHSTEVCMLFSFPAARGNKLIMIHDICIDVVTAFTGGTPSIDVGLGTIATNAVSTGGTYSETDADEFIPTGDITEATIGVYFPDGGDYHTAKAAGANAAPAVLVCADTTVPCIHATLTDGGTTGLARVHALISAIRMS